MRVRPLGNLLLVLSFTASSAFAGGPFITSRDASRSQLGIFEDVALPDEASAVWTNPAGIGFLRSSSAFFSQSFGCDTSYTNFLVAGGNAGFGWQRTDLGSDRRVDRWRFVTSGVDRAHGVAFGAAMQLADPDGLNQGTFWSADFGALVRPTTWISVGFVARQLGAPEGYPWALETGLAARPMGNNLTFFGGALWSKDDPRDDPSGWHVGALANLGPGVEVGLGVNQDRTVQAGLRLILGNAAVGASAQRARDDDRSGPGWAVVAFNRDYRATRLALRGNVGEIRLRGVIRDQGTGMTLFGGGTTPLNGILTQIRRAADAPDISGLYLRIEGVDIGQGMADELRDALVQFKEDSHKPIVAYLASADVREYYLASVADSIYLEPMGHLDFVGYAAHVMFLRRALNKLGVQPELVRVGKYKSATETFTDSTISEASREQLDELLDDWYEKLVDAVAKSRNVTTDSVRTLIDNGPYTASDAKRCGLVDALGYEDEAFESAKSLVRSRVGHSRGRVSMASRRPYDERWGPRPQVAVVFASGDIITGQSGVDLISGSQFIGSETMVKALRQVREDKAIRAVVLRIDSPGGSALASDMIWREVDKLRKTDKPLVVSVGDLAASGGYYLACAGDSIVANPGAIVGSIGIFGGKLTMQELFHKIGVDFDVLTRGENAAIYSLELPLTPEQREKLQDDVEQGYQVFLSRVADGRRMTTAEVDSIGQGHIYTGERGIDHGLIDRTGGLEDAIRMAMDMAKIADEAEIVSYPRRPSFWEIVREDPATRVRRGNSLEDRWFYDAAAASLR